MNVSLLIYSSLKSKLFNCASKPKSYPLNRRKGSIARTLFYKTGFFREQTKIIAKMAIIVISPKISIPSFFS